MTKQSNKITKFILQHGWAFFLFLFLMTMLNIKTEILGLYQDDLYLWVRFAENDAFHYIMTFGSTRCRPVWQLISWVLLKAIGTHTEWLVPVNIAVNAGIAWMLYLMAGSMVRLRISGQETSACQTAAGNPRDVACQTAAVRRYAPVIAGLAAGIAYTFSKFSYYQIGMVLGLMEATAMVGALIILYCLYRYLLETPMAQSRISPWLATAYASYFLTVFIHERYMALILVLILAPLMKKDNKKIWIPIAEFILIQLIRLWITGTLNPPGTGGTNISDTFDVMTALGYAFQQVFYIFGISTGPEHLCGIAFQDCCRWVQLVIEAGIACLILVVGCYILSLIHVRKRIQGCRIGNGQAQSELVPEEMLLSREWKIAVLFLTFMAMCIGSTSVTIRLEMRWVYVSFAAALLYLAHMLGVICAICEHRTESKPVVGSGQTADSKQSAAARPPRLAQVSCGLIVLYVICLIPTELYAWSYRPNLYYYSNQRRTNSLVEQTVEKYGDAFFEKDVFLLNNKFDIDEWTLQNFFRVYREDHAPITPMLHIVNGVEDFGLVSEHMMILAEDEKDNTYTDVTEFVKSQKFDRISGVYEDGWIDEHSEMVIQAGATGKIGMLCFYPYELRGYEKATVTYEPLNTAGQQEAKTCTIHMSEDHVSELIEVQPYEKVHIKIDCNFTLENAPEQRGDDPLAMVVYFTIG